MCPGKTGCLEEWSYCGPGTLPCGGNVPDELDKGPVPESPQVIVGCHRSIVFVLVTYSSG